MFPYWIGKHGKDDSVYGGWCSKNKPSKTVRTPCSFLRLYQEDKNGKKRPCRGTPKCQRCRANHRCHELKLPLCEKNVRQCEDETGNGNDFFDVHENDNEESGKITGRGRRRESPIIKTETSHSSGIILRGDSTRRR